MSHRRAKRERRRNKSHGPSQRPKGLVPVFVDEEEPVFGDPVVEKALKQLHRLTGGVYVLKKAN